MLFISCTDERAAQENYNPLINTNQIVSVERSNDDVNDFRIVFNMRNGETYEWLFDTITNRDAEYKRIEEILLEIP